MSFYGVSLEMITSHILILILAEDNSIPDYLNDSPQVRATFPVSLLTDYPHTSGILTKR